MHRLRNPGRVGWWGLLGGLLLGALLAVVFLRVVTIDNAWMVLAPLAIIVALAGTPTAR
jgi:hypothetical protein